MIEEMKDIKGYEGLYKVSNLGYIYSILKNKKLIGYVNNKGYRYVQLCKENKRKGFSVHRLVAETFIQNPENKPQVNHIDEDKTNNMVYNLEWVTPKENINHGTARERTMKHLRQPIKAIDIVSGEYNNYESLTQCGKELGIEISNISNQLKGKRKHVGGYIFEYTK